MEVIQTSTRPKKMHDTLELQKALNGMAKSKTFNPIVTPADGVKSRIKRTKFLIIANTDPSSKPGENERPIYFDSYGKPPSFYYKEWRHFDNFLRSTEDFQQRHTTVCGDHCLYVARRLVEGHSFKKILNSYRPKDEKTNDEAVHFLVHKHFKFLNKTKHYRTRKLAFIQKCQTCKPRRIEKI